MKTSNFPERKNERRKIAIFLLKQRIQNNACGQRAARLAESSEAKAKARKKGITASQEELKHLEGIVILSRRDERSKKKRVSRSFPA